MTNRRLSVILRIDSLLRAGYLNLGVKMSAKSDKKTSKVLAPKQPKVAKTKKKRIVKALKAIGGYFKGSWAELKQVRWPNRRSTWGMTAAVIVFTAFFVGLIVLLDFAFSQLFNLIIK